MSAPVREPARPRTAPASAHPRWPTLAAVAAILVVTGGGRLVSAAVSDDAPASIGVEGVATIVPPPGWAEDLAARRDDGTARRFVLTKGSAVLVMTVLPDARVAAPELGTAYLREALGARLLQVTAVPPVAVGGLPGARLTYMGLTPSRAAVEGVVTTVVAPDGAALVLDGFAPEGSLAAVAEDLARIAAEARIG